MIRGKLRKGIKDIIDSHPKFDYLDFEITAHENKNGNQLFIRFIPNPNFYISFFIFNALKSFSFQSVTYDIPCEMCPGELSYVEKINFDDKDLIITKIKKWLDNMWEEITSEPYVKFIEHEHEVLKSKIDSFMQNVKESVDENYFSNEEAVALREKLDEMEVRLKDYIEQSSQDKEVLEREISNLHRDISVLKDTIQAFNKKGWIKSFASKATKWANTTEVIKLSTEAISLIKAFIS